MLSWKIVKGAQEAQERAEQCLRMCRDGRGLGSKLVSFAKGFSKHPYILPIFKVVFEYLRLPFKVKVDYFILHSILVYNFSYIVCYEQRRCTYGAERFFPFRTFTGSSVNRNERHERLLINM